MTNSLSTTTASNPQSEIRNPKSGRPRRPPSQRDFDIYRRVKINGLPHWEVAHDLELDRSRVSQIVKRVTRWLAAGGDAIDPRIRDHFARQRLAQGDLKLRLQRAIELASHALQVRPPLESTRRRFQGTTEVWREEISRDVPRVNLTALRLIVDATKSLQQLEHDTNLKRERGTDSTDANLSEQDLLPAVFDFLCGCRARAESIGQLPASENVPALIAGMLTKLLGLPPEHFAHLAHQNTHQTLTVSAPPVRSIGTTTCPATTSEFPAEHGSLRGERSPQVETNVPVATETSSNNPC